MKVQHIEAKFVVVVWLVMFTVAVCCPGADAQEKKLISAQNSVWRTDLYLYRSLPTSDVATGVSGIHAGSGGCSTLDVSLASGQAQVTRDYTQTLPLLCQSSFQLLSAPEGAASFVVASFDNGAQKYSFRVEPIGSIAIDRPASIFPVFSDGVDKVIVNVFPSEAVTIFYALGSAAEESCNAAPPVTQCKVTAQGSGLLRVYLKRTVICNLCVDPKEVYGVVTNGRDNASLKAWGF